MDDNEQWLSDGNCKKCRRRNYCHEPCKRNKQRNNAVKSSIISSLFLSCLSKANDELSGRVTDEIIEYASSVDHSGRYIENNKDNEGE